MAESTRQVRTSDPFDRFDEAINDPGLYPTYQYERPESRQLEPIPQDRVPLFLSDDEYEDRFADGETPEYTFGSKRDKPRMSRIVTGAVAATAVAGVVGFFAMDTTRSVFINAKASLASIAPASLGGGAPPEATPPRVAAAPEPRIAAPEAQAVYRGKPTEATVAPAAAAAAVSTKPGQAANASPSREEIMAAYQSAVKGGQMAAVAPSAAAAPPPPAAPAPQARRMDPDELAGLLKRAKSLLAVGDIASARLLLERAADAQEAEAALMLGTTYDPVVIGNKDMRSIAPDPEMARQWYQKAAALGSADARRRLSELRN